MANNIHQQEEDLQRRWLAQASRNNDAESLCTDGLLFRGPISFRDGAWHREKGPEEAIWAAAPRRLLILTKDLNDDEGWDIRQETGRYNEAIFSYERAIAFYKNLRIWSYLMLTGQPDRMPSFKDARNMNIVGPFYEAAPIARVNSKKQVGKESIADNVLKHYLEAYSTLLRDQISLYGANIIFCCGCSGDTNLLLDFVRSQCLPDLQLIPDTGDWMYFSPSAGAIAVNSFHPSARIGYEDTFYKLAAAFQSALKWIRTNYNINF